MYNDIILEEANRRQRATALFFRQILNWLVVLLPLGLLIFFLSQMSTIASGEPLVAAWPWVPSLGVTFSFYVDGLGLLMALLVTGIGALIMLYGGQYLAGDTQLPRFYLFMTLFMVSMLGLVTSANLLILFLCWELTSISSYLLIGYKHKSSAARAAALQALLVTGSGGLAMLAGLLLLGSAAGSLELPVILANANAVQAHPMYETIVVLIVLGAFTKSAQFPFHFWLPGGMTAPTPASAYLHSATMVKAGVYLLARLSPVLGGTFLWMGTLVVFGGLTMLLGSWLAWQQTDLKRILAYSTASALGMLVMLLGIGTTIALKAAMVLILVHSLYKATLFMVAGNVDHATGTRDVTQLGGLARTMPGTAVAGGLAALAMVGMVPFLGFISKELLYEATLYAPLSRPLAWGLTAVAVAANVMNIVAAGLVAVKPFLGARTGVKADVPSEEWQMVAGPLILAGLGLVAAVMLYPLTNLVIQPAISAVSGAPLEIKLAFWHGINPMLVLSVITLLLGAALYVGRKPALARVSILPRGERYGPRQSYDIALETLRTGALALTRHTQNGQLRRYVNITLATATLFLGWSLWQTWPWQIPLKIDMSIRPYEVIVAGLILFAAGMATRTRSRLATIVALGVVGYGVTLIFTLFSAPDLAMTQFAIETLTVLLFMLVLYRLPRFVAHTTKRERVNDALVAISLGIVMTAIVLIAVALPHPTNLADFFAQSSLAEANGRNVVNVILVDFRGLDTLGEIIVLAIAAIGVYTLMKSSIATRTKETGTASKGIQNEDENKEA